MFWKPEKKNKHIKHIGWWVTGAILVGIFLAWHFNAWTLLLQLLFLFFMIGLVVVVLLPWIKKW